MGSAKGLTEPGWGQNMIPSWREGAAAEHADPGLFLETQPESGTGSAGGAASAVEPPPTPTAETAALETASHAGRSSASGQRHVSAAAWCAEKEQRREAAPCPSSLLPAQGGLRPWSSLWGSWQGDATAVARPVGLRGLAVISRHEADTGARPSAAFHPGALGSAP